MTDDSKMPFGKYKGQPLKDVPDGVLLYYYDHKMLERNTKLKEYVIDRILILRMQKDKKEKDS